MKNTTDFIFNGSELDIQNHIIENIEDICSNCFFGDVKNVVNNLKIKGLTSNGIFDLLVYHKDNSATLIEVKKYKGDVYLMSAIGQILFYGELCKIHFGNYPRMVIASDFIPKSLIATIRSNKIPIRLLELDGDKVTLI